MFPVVELVRLEENYVYGTFGVLKINKEVFCVTLEPRDEENSQGISSIPVQQYTCRRTHSINFGATFEVRNVPGRTQVLFHAGNVAENTKGCIILAQHFGKLYNNRAVLNSGKTLIDFMNIMAKYNEFSLTIQENL